MAYQPIENYGIIGNMRTCALVSMEGSVDWYCHPRFDSPSIFGAILDDKKGGRFELSITAPRLTRKQLYFPQTNVLITRFLTLDGIVEIEDFMPVGVERDSTWRHALIRRVRAVRGNIPLRLFCQPAFDYARQSHETILCSSGALFKSAKMVMALSSNGVPLQIVEKNAVQAEFSLEEGQSKVFVFYEPPSAEGCFHSPEVREAQDLFTKTVSYWQQWLSGCTYQGRWREHVHRSALVLKLLSYEPTGAMIAAPTCGLPEAIGGPRNWDYRYTWLRDSAFTIYGLLRIGFKKEAINFMNWLNSVASKFDLELPLQIVYGIDGRLELKEEVLDHLDGYMGSKPVRIGNAAYTQVQFDIYGELMDAFYLINKHVSPVSYDLWRRVRHRLDWLCDHWRDPDRGIWEVRAQDQQFVYTKLMCWVALDRGIRLAEKRSFPCNAAHWVDVRNAIYEEILAHGWSEKLQTFTQVYDGDQLDASNLIMPLVFFMAPTDPRMLKTIDAINRSRTKGGLASDGLVYRYDPRKVQDGLAEEEGTFNMCSFWLVEALTRAGQLDRSRLDEARLLFERILGFANHLGLYSEETSADGRALGNFPQTFTHVALISAAFNLNRTLGAGN
jgi:GH15 family glucan-1,4-alpha-glucosidase